MARAGRKKSASGVYHVLLRGVERIFVGEADYREFRSRLAEYFGGEVRLLAFLLLPNRVHLLIDEGGAEMSYAVKPLCTSYARYFNRTYSADGKLFYDRYKSVPAETADDIADTAAFLNAVGEKLTTADNYSLAEYENGAVLCDTKRLTDLIGNRVHSKKPSSLHLDDYGQLTKEEMEQYLEVVAGCTLAELAKMDRQSDEFKAVFAAEGVSARGILPLFGIHQTAAKKKAAQKEKKPEPAEEKPQQKRNLSVWLL